MGAKGDRVTYKDTLLECVSDPFDKPYDGGAKTIRLLSWATKCKTCGEVFEYPYVETFPFKSTGPVRNCPKHRGQPEVMSAEAAPPPTRNAAARAASLPARVVARSRDGFTPGAPLPAAMVRRLASHEMPEGRDMTTWADWEWLVDTARLHAMRFAAQNAVDANDVFTLESIKELAAKRWRGMKYKTNHLYLSLVFGDAPGGGDASMRGLVNWMVELGCFVPRGDGWALKAVPPALTQNEIDYVAEAWSPSKVSWEALFDALDAPPPPPSPPPATAPRTVLPPHIEASGLIHRPAERAAAVSAPPPRLISAPPKAAGLVWRPLPPSKDPNYVGNPFGHLYGPPSAESLARTAAVAARNIVPTIVWETQRDTNAPADLAALRAHFIGKSEAMDAVHAALVFGTKPGCGVEYAAMQMAALVDEGYLERVGAGWSPLKYGDPPKRASYENLIDYWLPKDFSFDALF